MKYATSPTPSESGSMLSGYSLRSGRSHLPRPATAICSSATTKTSKFVRRLIKFRQMDFEFALWQMLYLFVAPQKVYRNFGYRKGKKQSSILNTVIHQKILSETKSQFARDDPAFLVLLLASLCCKLKLRIAINMQCYDKLSSIWIVTSFGFVFLFNLGFFQTVYFILYVVFVDFLLAGTISATILWLISNKIMREPNAENVEWGYSFDVHINATFPPLIILHFIMLMFYKVLFSQEWFIARLLGNTLWLLATSYYVYITFLGYNCK